MIIFDEYDLILLGFDDIYAIYNELIRFSLENNFFSNFENLGTLWGGRGVLSFDIKEVAVWTQL